MASLALAFDILARDKASSELKKVGDAAEDTGRKGEKLKKGLAVAGAAIAAGAAVVGAAGVQLFNHGAALEALGNKARTVFGDQIGVVEKWAKANAAGMGLTSREATGLAASFGDLLVPMGFTREQAAKMSTDVVGLSGALSQWSGGQTSAAEAADILAKAMLGERDGLKSLGISISEADVQARLLKNGTDKLTGAALEQAKATATQQLIFEKSTDAQAAYEAGGNKLLTAQNNLRARFKEVFDELSVRLIPVFSSLAGFVVSTVIPTFERLWQQHGPAVKDAFRAISDFITNVGIPAFKAVAGFVVENVVPAVRDLAANILGGLQAAFNTIRDKIKENRPQLEALFGALRTVAEFIGVHLVPVLSVVLKEAFRVLGEVIGTAIGVIGGIVTAFTAVKDTAQTVLRVVVEAFLGFVETLVSGAAKAFGWVPGIGEKLRGAAAEIRAFRDAANIALDGIKDKTITVRLKTEGQRDAAAAARNAARGDGPGAVGGSTLARVTPILNRYGGYVTSTYRTPEENRRVGGSPRSYHLDRNNPAVDIGGTTSVLNNVAGRLRGMGGWRELLWQVPGHYDHIHVAHQGGQVASSWPTMPGLRSDERPVITQIGEDIIPRGGIDSLIAEITALRGDVKRIVRDYQTSQRTGALV